MGIMKNNKNEGMKPTKLALLASVIHHWLCEKHRTFTSIFMKHHVPDHCF